jgi:hypothetical protein
MCKVLRLYSRANIDSPHPGTVNKVEVLCNVRFGNSDRELPLGASRFNIATATSIIPSYITKVQLSLRQRSWLFALSTPSGSSPIIVSYGKNTFAMACSRESRGARLHAYVGGLRRSLGGVQYSASTHDDGVVSCVSFHAKFR